MGVPHDRSSRPARPARGAWSRTGGAILDLLDRPIRQWLSVHFLVNTPTIPAPAPPPDAEVPHLGGSTGTPPELRAAGAWPRSSPPRSAVGSTSGSRTRHPRRCCSRPAGTAAGHPGGDRPGDRGRRPPPEGVAKLGCPGRRPKVFTSRLAGTRTPSVRTASGDRSRSTLGGSHVQARPCRGAGRHAGGREPGRHDHHRPRSGQPGQHRPASRPWAARALRCRRPRSTSATPGTPGHLDVTAPALRRCGRHPAAAAGPRAVLRPRGAPAQAQPTSPVRPAAPGGQAGWLTPALAALAAALALVAGGAVLAGRRTTRTHRNQSTA
jgi:hypothetical protein